MTATKAILSEVLNFGICILLEGTAQISAVKTDPGRRLKITYSEKNSLSVTGANMQRGNGSGLIFCGSCAL